MRHNPLLYHHLATLAYRAGSALRDAPPNFGSFSAGAGVRTPHQLLNHMTNLLWFTDQSLRGLAVQAKAEAPTFDEEVLRFDQMLQDLAELLAATALERAGLSERLLQGPLSDAMTHVGQLALLRRLAGSPVPPEDFFSADVGAALD